MGEEETIEARLPVRIPAQPVTAAPRARKYRKQTLQLFHLAANQLSIERMIAMTGYSRKRIEWMVLPERAQAEIAQITWQLSGGDSEKAFRRLIPETIQVQATIMRDRTVKPATRLAASVAIQDRALGKAAQKIDVTHKSSVRVMLEEIQRVQGIPQFTDIEADWIEVGVRDPLPMQATGAPIIVPDFDDPAALERWIADLNL